MAASLRLQLGPAMTGQTVRDIRARLGVPARAAAHMVGVTTRTWNRWELTGVDAHGATLLNLLDTMPQVRNALRQRLDR